MLVLSFFLTMGGWMGFLLFIFHFFIFFNLGWAEGIFVNIFFIFYFIILYLILSFSLFRLKFILKCCQITLSELTKSCGI